MFVLGVWVYIDVDVLGVLYIQPPAWIDLPGYPLCFYRIVLVY